MKGKVFGVGLWLLLVGLLLIPEQTLAQSQTQEGSEGKGRLNVWTTGMVLREDYTKRTDFLTMRVGTHKGFDRVVFEMGEALPKYYVKYEKPPFSTYDGRDFEMRGKAFIEISFYPVSYSDERRQASERLERQQNKINWPVIRQVLNSDWFEGEIIYRIGLKRRTPFRVQTLSNPSRLVVDFKH